MALHKIEKTFDVIGKGFDILTTVACIIFVGVIAYFVLSVMGYTGALRLLLSCAAGLLGGFVFKLIVYGLAYFSSY